MNSHNLITISKNSTLAAIVLCFGANSQASTPMEDEISTRLMPHQMLANSGSVVKVHFVRLDGYLESKPDNAEQIVQLKKQVQYCVDAFQKSGQASKPPSRWPAYITSLRQDIYSAENRTIEYSNGTSYAVNFSDCSLLESVLSKAQLVSGKGTCNIDFIRKTAIGACDVHAHADAAIEKIPFGPELILGQSEQKKKILNIECSVWNRLPGAGGGTMCLASGGTFRVARAARNPANAGLLLELDSKIGYVMKAKMAQLDAEVNAQVFSPYLTGSFEIKNIESRK